MSFPVFNDPTQRPRCPACYAPVVYVQMGPTKEGEPGGKVMCNPGWQYGDGNRTLIVPIDHGHGIIRGKMIQKADEGVMGYEPHHGTCQRPEGLRTKPKKQRPTPAAVNVLPISPN